MMAALPRSGKGERTQQASVRAVRLLAQCYPTSPDRMTERELQYSFLPRNNVDGLAPASMCIGSRGIRFFSPHVLQRDWHTLTRLRSPPRPARASAPCNSAKAATTALASLRANTVEKSTASIIPVTSGPVPVSAASNPAGALPPSGATASWTALSPHLHRP
jgi:hypothetical protein